MAGKRKRKSSFIGRILRCILTVILVIALFVGCCVFYAFKIEPYRVTTKEIELNAASQAYLRIVQFSDTHVKEDFTSEDLDRIVNAINAEDPEVVVFTGDLYDNYALYSDDAGVIAELQKINASYEKIAIWGNRDYGGGASRQYESIMEQGGFTVLKNQNWYVTTQSGKKVLFTGLDDEMLGSVSMPDATKIYDSDYDILLVHEPDVAEEFLDYPYDLVLSGHTHGGQINIPFLPMVNEMAMSATALADHYVGGMYDLDADTKMYVNTGIGTTHISARFGVVPQITVFTIYL